MPLADRLARRFTAPLPLFLIPEKDALKLELKPYLQPFEEILAVRELNALLGPSGNLKTKYGYYLAYTKRPEAFFRERLTYWQRVGRSELVPTVQKALEFTQNGLSADSDSSPLHSARRLRYGPHDLHEYRGKFFPQLVRSLINISGVPDDGIVCDPMCGSGTAPCESLASGRSTIAADLNPLSVLITRVKAGLVLAPPEEFRRTVARYLKAFTFSRVPSAHRVWSSDDLDYLRRWFAPAALEDLAAVLSVIARVRNPFYRDFFRVCLSNVLRSLSWQKEVDLRVRKDVRPYEAHTAITRFTDEVRDQAHRIHPYLSLLQERTTKTHLDVRQGNAVDVGSLFPSYMHRVDLLITSPPYATALPYLDTDRLSLIVLGLLPRSQHKELEALMVGTREVTEKERVSTWTEYQNRRHELPVEVSRLIDSIAEHNHGPSVGFRRRNLPALLGRYFIQMLDSMRSARKLMRSKGKAYYVVGNNSTNVDGEKVEIPTDRFLYAIGATAGWKQDELISMELIASRDIFRENRGSAETILCFSTK